MVMVMAMTIMIRRGNISYDKLVLADACKETCSSTWKESEKEQDVTILVVHRVNKARGSKAEIG